MKYRLTVLKILLPHTEVGTEKIMLSNEKNFFHHFVVFFPDCIEREEVILVVLYCLGNKIELVT